MKVFIEVRVENLEVAESLHDAMREFIDEFAKNMEHPVEYLDGGPIDED